MVEFLAREKPDLPANMLLSADTMNIFHLRTRRSLSWKHGSISKQWITLVVCVNGVQKCVMAVGRTWHPEHFCCTLCHRQLTENDDFFEKDGLILCRSVYSLQHLFYLFTYLNYSGLSILCSYCIC